MPQMPRKLPSLPSNYTMNIYAMQGTTVVLPCRVFNLGSATLSWIRRPSLTVLSHGDILFSSSDRLKLLHSFGSPDWNLQITNLQLEDSGIYECQVNTEPKLSRSVNLDVRVADTGQTSQDVPALALQGGWQQNPRRQRTEILAPPEVRVLEGGNIALECVVTEHQAPPPGFTWFIGEVALDFHQHRGGVLLEEERRLRSSSSKLTITRLQLNESAVYTCSPQMADSASVRSCQEMLTSRFVTLVITLLNSLYFV